MMNSRYPQAHSRGLLRRSYITPRPSSTDRYGRIADLYPDFDGLRIDPRVGPVFLDVGNDVFNVRPRNWTSASRFQDTAAEPEQLVAISEIETARRRGQNIRNLGRLSPRPEFVHEYGEKSSKPGITYKRKEALPFVSAMKGLHRKLEAAKQTYIHFQSEYDTETESIKKYATKEILEDLWTSKMRSKKGRSVLLEDQHGDEDDRYGYEEKFAGWKRKIAQALDEVLNSSIKKGTLNTPKNITRYQSMVRLREKLYTANRQILPLLDDVSKGREYCKALITELDLLKTLISPDHDNTRELYRGGDSDEVDASSDIEDGDKESGQWQ